MEKQLNFKRDMASYTTRLIKLPQADRIMSQYERGLLTLDEAFESLQNNEKDIIAREVKSLYEDAEYLYGMRIRPFGIGCQPEGFTRNLDDAAKTIVSAKINRDKGELANYHDVIAYSRRLTEEEVEHFSLDYLGVLVA